MDTLPLAGSASSLPSVIFAFLFIAVLALLPRLQFRFKLSKLPHFGASKNGEKQHSFFVNYAEKLYRDGYKKAGKSQAHCATSD